MARAAHRGPLRVQRPFYPEGDRVCHVYLLHPPGGVVGGDSLATALSARAGAAALLTTPGATRLYRSAGPAAIARTRIEVEAGASLEHLPQETIAFSGCEAALSLEIDLAPGARYLGWEVVALGRPAAGETFSSGSLEQWIALRGAGRPVYVERAVYRGGEERLGARHGLAGHPVTGALVAVGPLGDVRRLCTHLRGRRGPGLASATLLEEDVLLCRYLGDEAADALACFEEVRRMIRPVLLGREAIAPRIWAT
jgi:urease accessory protein